LPEIEPTGAPGLNAVKMERLSADILRECIKWLPADDGPSALYSCTGDFLDGLRIMRDAYFKTKLGATHLHSCLSCTWADGDTPVKDGWIEDMRLIISRETPQAYGQTLQETADDLLYYDGFPYFQTGIVFVPGVQEWSHPDTPSRRCWTYRPNRVKHRLHCYTEPKMFYTTLFGREVKYYYDEEICAVYRCRYSGFVRRAIKRSLLLKALIN